MGFLDNIDINHSGTLFAVYYTVYLGLNENNATE